MVPPGGAPSGSGSASAGVGVATTSTAAASSASNRRGLMYARPPGQGDRATAYRVPPCRGQIRDRGGTGPPGTEGGAAPDGYFALRPRSATPLYRPHMRRYAWVMTGV